MVQHKATSPKKARPLSWLLDDPDAQEAIEQLGARRVDLSAVDAVLRAAQIEKKEWDRIRQMLDSELPEFWALPDTRDRLVSDLERFLEFYRRHVVNRESARSYQLAEELHTRLTNAESSVDFMWTREYKRGANLKRGPRRSPPLYTARQQLKQLKVPYDLATVLLRAAGLIPPKKNK